MQRHTPAILSALIAALGAAAASGASAAENIYMKIAGVTGTVTAAGYVGDIEILSYSQGFSNTGTSVYCSDTSVMKSIDTSSQYFSRSVLEQSAPFNATLYFVDSGTLIADTTIVMKGVTVTSVQHSGSEGGGKLTESVSMHAASLVVTYTNGTVKETYTATCP